MREVFCFRDKYRMSRKMDINFHDGLVSGCPEEYTETATYHDGTMSVWSLFIHNGDDDWHSMLVGHSTYLPVYMINDAHELVEALRFLEATLCGLSIDDDLEDY